MSETPAKSITFTFLLGRKASDGEPVLAYLTMPWPFTARDLYWVQRHLELWCEVLTEQEAAPAATEEPAVDGSAEDEEQTG